MFESFACKPMEVMNNMASFEVTRVEIRALVGEIEYKDLEKFYLEFAMT